MKYKITFALLLFIICPRLLAQDGLPDNSLLSFSKITSIGTYEDRAQCVAVQTDGKIVVAGHSKSPTNSVISVIRFNSDGTLDNTFSDDHDGIITTSVTASYDYAYGIAIQPDGKIVVVGSATDADGGENIVVIRYTADGEPDPDFSIDHDGIVTTDILGGDVDRAMDVAIHTDGSIVVAGFSENAIAVVRYTTNGILDASFDDDGIVLTSLSSEYAAAKAVAIQTDGSIVVAGSYLNNIILARYTTNGDLDNTFSADYSGIVQTSAGSSCSYAKSIAIQNDGNIVVTGVANNGSDDEIVTIRYTSNGILDNTFSGDGIAITDVSGTADAGNKVILQTDGKIIVAGTTLVAARNKILLIRYESDGDLDNTYSSDGILTSQVIPASHNYGIDAALLPDNMIVVVGYANEITKDRIVSAYFNSSGSPDYRIPQSSIITVIESHPSGNGKSIAIQSDGKIIVAGTSYTGSDGDITVIRYNSNGTPDPSFSEDHDGAVTTSVSTGTDNGNDVAIQSDGKIVVVGDYNNSGQQNIVVVRYNSDGTLDNSFGTAGIKSITTGIDNYDYGESIAIQPDGKIVILGNGCNEDAYFILIRLKPDGTPDNTFSDDGILTTILPFSSYRGNDIELSPDGKILVTGYAKSVSAPMDLLVLQYNPDGTLDNSFSGDGLVATDIGTHNDFGESIAVQSDGKIVVTGYSDNGSNNDIAVLRYNTDGTLDGTFSGDGIVTTQIGLYNDVGKSISIQADGKIVVGGNYCQSDGSDMNLAVIRYESDGDLDNTFSDDFDGIVTTEISTLDDDINGVAIQPDGKIVAAGLSYNPTMNFALSRFTGSSGPMPVELIAFTAKAINEGIELKWSTATEVNNYGFQLEREKLDEMKSREAGEKVESEWEVVGFVEGSGNSNSPKEYSFVDANPPLGNIRYRLKQIDTDGSYVYYNEIAEVNYSLTGVEEKQLPTEFGLSQNYPNPFNPSTVISYQLPVNSHTTLKIYDILGNEVVTLVNEQQQQGFYNVKFDGSSLASGIYIYRLTAGDFTSTKKLILMK